MIINSTIPIRRFADAFERVGWQKQTSKSGKYIIWTDPSDDDTWTRLPISEADADYPVYQQKNLLILLYALDLAENQSNTIELASQLKAYNYKLINRIVGNQAFGSEAIPYELATMIPEKNIEAFRYFYATKVKKRTLLPIEKFEFNHTEQGSFVIPVSILVDEPQPSTVRLPSHTNLYLHQYLNAIEELIAIPQNHEADFADRVIAQSIDSKIVKDFFGRGDSIARYKDKYVDRVKDISIGSKGSSLLDFGLKKEEKEFKEVDLGNIRPLKEDYLEVLENREVLSDESTLEADNVRIDVLVDSIDILGKAKFTVLAIDGIKNEKSFKARSGDLSKARLDKFADYFKTSQALTLRGDIKKAKGKLGTIIVDDLEFSDSRPTLFDDPKTDDRNSQVK
jgi:hypothetical protein